VDLLIGSPSALFHEIPIPLSASIRTLSPKQRKLTEGIVDLVTNKWLSPDIIAEKLNEVDLQPFGFHPATQTSTEWNPFNSKYSIKIQHDIAPTPCKKILRADCLI
jgi:hypothetical protein